jgi:CHAT domain-containing protein
MYFRSSLLCLILLWSTGALPVLTYAAGVDVDQITQQPSSRQLVQQATQLYQNGDYTAAIAVWQQTVTAFQAVGDGSNQAMALSNLSLTHQQLGQWPQATAAITEALKQLEPNSQSPLGGKRSSNAVPPQLRASVLSIQGRLQLSLGQAQAALETWQQTAKLYGQANDPTGELGSQVNQAEAMQELGFYRNAARLLQPLQPKLEQQPDSLLKTAGLRNLGNILQVLGDLKQSQQILEQSLAVAQRLRSQTDIDATLLSLGNTARARQEFQTALNLYGQVSRRAVTLVQIQSQLNQLSLLITTEQWQEIQHRWPQILASVTTLPPSRAANMARIQLADSLIKLLVQPKPQPTADWPSAIDIAQLLSATIQQAQTLSDRTSEAYAKGTLGHLYEQTQQTSEAQKLTQQALLISQNLNAADLAYQWQWQLGRLLRAQGNQKGAIAAYSAALNNLRSLRNDLVTVNPEVQLSFRDEVEPVYRQMVDLLLQSAPGSPVNQANLVQARSVIESLQLAELNNFFRITCLEGKPVQIDQVIDQTDPTAAALYPIILPDRLEIILKLPQKPLIRYTTAVRAEQTESTLEQLRWNLARPEALLKSRALAQKVYTWLIAPVAKELAQSQVKTLVLVPDGSFRNIPMAALYDGNQYLIEQYAIAIAPGLQLISPRPLPARGSRMVAAGITEPRFGFPSLPHVGQELQEISTEFPSRVLLNERFTNKALQTQVGFQPFSIVHLATHGQFSSKVDETFIVAWDRRITIDELMNLVQSRERGNPTPIELLILSACQTAKGDRRATLGLAGVAVRAGARSTIASLWSVYDQSTAELMNQFYRELSRKSVSKAEALRQAQLTLLRNPKYQRPLFWAPYVLLGNWL